MKIVIEKQKGVSLIITFFIMIILLAIVLSVSIILYGEVKVTRNMSNSMVSLYAAESGIEKVLYYDKQVVPTGATRGLCAIFSSCTAGTTGDTSIYCCNNSVSGSSCPAPAPLVGAAGCTMACSASNCTCCSISFGTIFDGRIYYTTATVSPDATDKASSDFIVDSRGDFGSSQRGVEISIYPNGSSGGGGGGGGGGTNFSVTGVKLNQSSSILNVGNTYQLFALVLPSTATNQNVNWSSSNPGIATVDNDGLVTAIAFGYATITATTVDGGFTDTDYVTVESAVPGIPPGIPGCNPAAGECTDVCGQIYPSNWPGWEYDSINVACRFSSLPDAVAVYLDHAIEYNIGGWSCPSRFSLGRDVVPADCSCSGGNCDVSVTDLFNFDSGYFK